MSSGTDRLNRSSVLSARAVAERLGVSKSFVYDEIKAGRLPHLRLGQRRYVIESEQLDHYLALRRVTAEEAAANATGGS